MLEGYLILFALVTLVMKYLMANVRSRNSSERMDSYRLNHVDFIHSLTSILWSCVSTASKFL